ncbi:hypothetical protein Bca101_042836 [Brassica carinata]
MDYSDDNGMLYIESGEENLYSDHTSESDYGMDEDMHNDSTSTRSQISYVVLKEEDIREHQKADIEQVSTVLSIDQVKAIILLLHYRWSSSKRVRKTVGILKEHVVDLNDQEVNTECGICFESYLHKEIVTVSCGHPYCKNCWTSYITEKINNGPGCLMIKCPEPSCSAVVGQDMIDKFITIEEDKEKYYRYFLRSYVEERGNKIKWCHHLDAYTRLILEPEMEPEIMMLLVYVLMTFAGIVVKMLTVLAKRVKRTIDRYMHYYERWANNQSSRLKAVDDLKKLQAVQIEKLSVKQDITKTQLQFTVDAWLQEERTKKQFFEYLQGEAEVVLERLHHCAEEELQHFNGETYDPSTNFDDFRKKLIGLTKVTKTYFENLVKALENDLADVAVDDCK